VERWAPLALVDLDQPAAAVGSVDPVFVRKPVREPGPKVSWHVLLLATEVQNDPPAAEKTPGRRPKREERSEQQLFVVSLREGSAPKLLHQRTLLERWPDVAERGGRAPARIGRRIEGLQLGRLGQDIVMNVIERDIDSSSSHCLRPEPVELRYRLVDLRFEALGGSSRNPACLRRLSLTSSRIFRALPGRH